MFTTEEKVNLLKKCQAEWINNRVLSTSSWEHLRKAGVKSSFIRIDNKKKPEEITMQDIIAEER